jgi:hypothetical protein
MTASLPVSEAPAAPMAKNGTLFSLSAAEIARLTPVFAPPTPLSGRCGRPIRGTSAHRRRACSGDRQLAVRSAGRAPSRRSPRSPFWSLRPPPGRRCPHIGRTCRRYRRSQPCRRRQRRETTTERREAQLKRLGNHVTLRGLLGGAEGIRTDGHRGLAASNRGIFLLNFKGAYRRNASANPASLFARKPQI